LPLTEAMHIHESNEPSSCGLKSGLAVEGNSSPRKTKSVKALDPALQAAGRIGEQSRANGVRCICERKRFSPSHVFGVRVDRWRTVQRHCEALDAVPSTAEPRRVVRRAEALASARELHLVRTSVAGRHHAEQSSKTTMCSRPDNCFGDLDRVSRAPSYRM
jgi:hypothetical protein